MSNKQKSQNNKITIYCDGGCGRSVTLRKSKIRKAEYYLCHSVIDGKKSKKSLPPLRDGMVRIVDMDAASCFWGYTYKWPDIETAQSMQRAKDILHRGLEQLNKKQF